MPSILQGQEKEIIESALAESRGKVAGADGAAAKLGIPPSTLDSKIKQLRIKKDNFKTVAYPPSRGPGPTDSPVCPADAPSGER